MTKEEYKKLLQSDYWKGYSYSLIKERDFTCEDCGRRFYNERNKLQVHHLVYRDVNPWSYSPDEVVVLCEDCHKKRHSIFTEPEQTTSYTQNPFGTYNDDSSFADSSTAKAYSSRSFEPTEDAHRSPYPIEPEPRRFKLKYVLYGLLLCLFVMIGRDYFTKQKPLGDNRPSYESTEKAADEDEATIEIQPSEKNTDSHVLQKTQRIQSPVIDNSSITSVEEDVSAVEIEQPTTKIPVQEERYVTANSGNAPQGESNRELSTLEILERRNHADVVRRAQRAGVSTEGTTIEILERINHADVMKRAKRAGVSTEGSTIEILERINHADVVKRAQRAGVSTEGSTIEILERINHADVVKRAKRAGVSTEGTTLEILERITRKEMEKYNY